MQTWATIHMHKASRYSKFSPVRDHTFPLPKTPTPQAPVGCVGAACPGGSDCSPLGAGTPLPLN